VTSTTWVVIASRFPPGKMRALPPDVEPAKENPERLAVPGVEFF
jgi:hypothetical protein